MDDVVFGFVFGIGFVHAVDSLLSAFKRLWIAMEPPRGESFESFARGYRPLSDVRGHEITWVSLGSFQSRHGVEVCMPSLWFRSG